MGGLRVLHSQEVEVYYLLPTIRCELARALKQQGHDQKTIAAFLGLTGAAVSQYMNGKRGSEVVLPGTFCTKVCDAAATISDAGSAYIALQALMREARHSKVLCDIHMKMDNALPTNCDVCFQ